MRVSDAFPSNYVKASDLQDKNVLVVISHVAMEDIGDDNKPVLYFQGKDKGMVMNKTNANNIATVYGDDTEDWTGKEIVLFPAMVDFQGRTVPAIRVRAPQAKDRRNGNGAPRQAAPPARPAAKPVQQLRPQQQAQPQDEENPAPNNDHLDDEIPF